MGGAVAAAPAVVLGLEDETGQLPNTAGWALDDALLAL
jgi:hypothetical protein